MQEIFFRRNDFHKIVSLGKKFRRSIHEFFCGLLAVHFFFLAQFQVSFAKLSSLPVDYVTRDMRQVLILASFQIKAVIEANN